MPLAAIALGSNLAGEHGSREAILEGAVNALNALGTVKARSTWHETDPVGYAEQPRFLNGAVLLQTDLPPQELLRGLLRVEQRFGRDRTHGIANGPRTLDLDLLLYDDLILEAPELVLPHPAMHTRSFVLAPLAEIAPDWIHPLLRTSVRDLFASVSCSA
ncbi:2-amino-4-hydroxy-6-hydroxymethyldihydropteridine diphosphokinase [Terriglobus aquaticus]|uniref:2-amino-4-hydroxy-6-hydroxymethyldihydropteridine pyrophosphokinase n=1 Tax=Terriglobus aquaticus TaxID=940139 RepID=A0ABW9KN31_9BACT|nr:2-amino-4-hydroxy-6-hydroxymethyldihydropteridine diphosphokinase [Terriglobus aquaticus]